MWITNPQSPNSTNPNTPVSSSIHLPSTSPTPPTHPPNTNFVAGSMSSSSSGSSNSNRQSLTPLPPSAQPHLPAPAAPPQTTANAFPQPLSTAIPANFLPGARISGQLVGVVSLTDILNLYARSSGLSPADPSVYRTQRRRSSSSSLGVRKSGDIAREVWNRTGV